MAIFYTFNNPNSSRQFLNHFSLLRLLVVFWLVKTYQHGCHPSVLSHHALGKTECDESYCIEGNHIWSFFRRGAGIFLSWVILQRERHHDHIWIFEHSIFLWRQFRVGVMPRNGKWVCLWPYMVPSFPPWVFGVHKMSPSYLLTTDIKQIQNLLSQASNWSRSLKKVIKRRKGLVLDVL